MLPPGGDVVLLHEVLRASCSLNMSYQSVSVCEPDDKPGVRFSSWQCLHDVCVCS